MSGRVCGVRGDAWGVVPCLVCPFERLRSDLSFGSHFCGIDLFPNRSIDCERATGTVKPVPTTVSGRAEPTMDAGHAQVCKKDAGHAHHLPRLVS